MGETRGLWNRRGLETHSDPRVGLLMGTTSPERVRYLQARGRGSASGERMVEKRADVPSSAGATGPLAHDRRLVMISGIRVPRDLGELGLSWLELDVWLARPLLRYAARNFSIENTVPRDSM